MKNITICNYKCSKKNTYIYFEKHILFVVKQININLSSENQFFLL